MKFRWSIIWCCALIAACATQASHERPEDEFADEITVDGLRTHLSIIASDSMQGRRTGTHGQAAAAAYLAGQFKEIGLTPLIPSGYYQNFKLYAPAVESASLELAGHRHEHMKDILFSGDGVSAEGTLPVIFAGSGSERDYAGLDVSGKAVAILRPIPPGSISVAFETAADISSANGARLLVVIAEGEKQEWDDMMDHARMFRTTRPLSLASPAQSNNNGIFVISTGMAKEIFGTGISSLKNAVQTGQLQKIKTGQAKFQTTIRSNEVEVANVAGMVEGTTLKNEVVVMSAHYDHIGMLSAGPDHINNGADDDGSGTVAVLEVARAFSLAKANGNGPRRTLLFLTFAGEEQGLLGSEFYSEHPLRKLSETVADINVDMIGRADESHADSTHYVYVIGPDKLSQDLFNLNEAVNARHERLKFDYTYNDENHPTNLYHRSDHWNFAKKGVPVAFFFDGLHADYHQPTDEVSRIDFELLKARTRAIYFLMWELANRDQRLAIDKH